MRALKLRINAGTSLTTAGIIAAVVTCTLRNWCAANLTNISVGTHTIGTSRILHTIPVHKVHVHLRHNFVTVIPIILGINIRTIHIIPREDHRGRRARSRGRTMHGFRRWGTEVKKNIGAVKLTGRTFTIVRGGTEPFLQCSCGDDTTGVPPPLPPTP